MLNIDPNSRWLLNALYFLYVGSISPDRTDRIMGCASERESGKSHFYLRSVLTLLCEFWHVV